ncbi:site-specific integrase [Ruminiclostridium cellulolyticum]|uniref:Integrase family protein n=1 Tax=Ruminiclostridium cellulolyticum (strain ATCC 35319 / DSM 5812 / JCM 6584 / H10) TaxID=394503 RepID=B8I4A3_RUMCH|nr:site-specific integrase [Ruminiclostridium cellulolyticum]ACL74457.1 integrase family protein [Ruminiclostridium cellulolyticum H10]
MYLVDFIGYRPEYFEQGYTHFKIGNSFFEDDTWNFIGLTPEQAGKPDCRFLIKFGEIKKPRLRFTTKQIVLSWCLTLEILSVQRKLVGIKKFIHFIEHEYPEIDAYSKVNKGIVCSYITWMLGVKKNGKLLSASDIKFGSLGLKDLFIEGMRKGWDVPQNCGWIALLHEEMVLKSPRVRKFSREKTTKKAYAKETIETIIKCALQDDNIFVRAAVIIQTQVGLRISELLSIKDGCINYVNGIPQLTYITTKTKKQPMSVEKPINSLVVQVITELEEYTRAIRKKAGLESLFVHRIRYDTKTVIIAYHTFGKNFLRPFVKRWDIKEDGEPLELTSHYFRHFFAQGAWKGGMPVQFISKMLNHDSLVMTETYTYSLQEQMNEKFIEIMSNPENLAGVGIGRIKERLRSENPFQGKTEREIKIIMEAMRIRILANGICMHHPARRESCPISDGESCMHCPNFVSPRVCIPVHKLRVERITDEIKRAEKQGNTIWLSKLMQEKEYIEQNFIRKFECREVVQ